MRTWGVLAALALAACTEPSGWDAPLTPIEQLPWPTPVAPPACTPAWPSFALPVPAAATGRVRVANPVAVDAIGVTTTLELVALDAAETAIDPVATGTVTLDLGGAGTVVSVARMYDGRTKAVVRLDRAGPITVTARLESDGRTGTSQVIGYASQLPVWELAIEPAMLAMMLAMPYVRITAPVALTVDGVGYTGTVRLHGASSLGYPKKSFRIDLDDGQAIEGADHFILRSEWNDKAMLRNRLSFALFRDATWLAAPAAEHVHLRVNDRFYGLMTHPERIDKDFLRARGLATTGSLYEADPPSEKAVPGGNLTPLPTADYPIVYDHQAGTIAYDDLIALIEDTLRRPQDELMQVLGQEVVVDDVLVYLAATAVIQNQDHTRKNYYLYRDPARAEGWRIIPWDLELTWGHLWTEANDVLEEAIAVDGDPYIGLTVLHNELFTRLLGDPTLRARFDAMVARILDAGATDAWLDARLDHALCAAMPEILTDTRKRASNDEYLGRVDELRAYLDGRRAFLRR